MNDSLKRVTPQDATDFEREQLRFFLSSADMADTLTEINPSLAWLPILAELNLLQNDAALPLWVERNFSSAQAVAEVVENIRFFRSESANILEYRLNGQRDRLDPLLTKCWQLIIRHIRNRQQGLFQHRWFLELLPRLKKADLSANALQGVGEVLTPKLFVEKRFVLHDELPRKIAKPTDLMSVRYRVDEGVGANDFLAAWPKNAKAVADEQLLQILTNSLEIVLADAVELGVESNDSLSISDIDVPSIAAHEQLRTEHQCRLC